MQINELYHFVLKVTYISSAGLLTIFWFKVAKLCILAGRVYKALFETYVRYFTIHV